MKIKILYIISCVILLGCNCNTKTKMLSSKTRNLLNEHTEQDLLNLSGLKVTSKKFLKNNITHKCIHNLEEQIYSFLPQSNSSKLILPKEIFNLIFKYFPVLTQKEEPIFFQKILYKYNLKEKIFLQKYELRNNKNINIIKKRCSKLSISNINNYFFEYSYDPLDINKIEKRMQHKYSKKRKTSLISFLIEKNDVENIIVLHKSRGIYDSLYEQLILTAVTLNSFETGRYLLNELKIDTSNILSDFIKNIILDQVFNDKKYDGFLFEYNFNLFKTIPEILPIIIKYAKTPIQISYLNLKNTIDNFVNKNELSTIDFENMDSQYLDNQCIKIKEVSDIYNDIITILKGGVTQNIDNHTSEVSINYKELISKNKRLVYILFSLVFTVIMFIIFLNTLGDFNIINH